MRKLLSFVLVLIIAISYASCIKSSNIPKPPDFASEKPVSHFEFYRLLVGVMGMDECLITSITSENPYKDYFNVSKAKALLKTVIRDFV